MKIRVLLIILVIVLSVSFVTEFWLNVDELRRIQDACDSSPGFSCDYVPQHPVGLLHALSFVLLGTVAFAKKYYWALTVAIVYLALHIFGTYARLGTGSFGGDMCPEGHPCWVALRRATWFDQTAFIILAVATILIAWKLLRRNEVEHFA